MSDPYHWIHPHLPWRCQPMSHHTSNREVTTSRIPLQPISRSESPRDGTLGITRHWIQNDTNVGDKIDQPNQLKLCQIFKWCQTVEPFFVRKWLKDSHSLGWKASIYIYTYIHVSATKTQQCWVTFNWMVAGDDLTRFHCWILSQWMNGSLVENGWCLLHPELTSFQWGVFGVSSWHALPSTSSATPPRQRPQTSSTALCLACFLVSLSICLKTSVS